ncbi:MAG: DUF1616 domain-containing protein [Methanoregula sp.]|jgi:uncharacterized membrane protein|nr:DUF1616 domain-containing protein [Methanoregula sp.]
MEPAQHPYDTLAAAFANGKIPRDLLACELWLLCAIFSIYLPVLNESALRIIFGMPIVLFIPGYALIAALFPAAEDIDGIERVALSFGLSIAIVPLAGLALNYTPWGIRLDPIITCLAILTVGLCFAAQYRRARLPLKEQFSVPFRKILQEVKDEFFPKNDSSRTDRILSLILLIAIIAAVGTTVYVIVVPKEGEKFTEFFILGEKQKAADYPARLVPGVNSSLFIGIGNHEYRQVNYTVETYLLQMTFNETTNTSTLVSMNLLNRFTVPVAHNETAITPYSFAPETTDVNRLEFLLFNETVPDDRVRGMDRINESYRDLHLWITVRSLTG